MSVYEDVPMNFMDNYVCMCVCVNACVCLNIYIYQERHLQIHKTTRLQYDVEMLTRHLDHIQDRHDKEEEYEDIIYVYRYIYRCTCIGMCPYGGEKTRESYRVQQAWLSRPISLKHFSCEENLKTTAEAIISPRHTNSSFLYKAPSRHTDTHKQRQEKKSLSRASLYDTEGYT